MAQSDVFRMALVGCGGMGRGHLSTVKRLDGFEIAAVCDLFEESLNRAGDEYGVKARFTDVDAMLDSVELDMIAVATQTRGHRHPTVAALERGVSVLCEKPIAIDLVEADEMVVAAKASGAKFSINQQNFLHPGILKAKRLLEDGLIGELVGVRGRTKAGRKSGNEFMEMGTHHADMMIRFGGMPDWCSGTVWYEGRLAQLGDVMEAKEMSPRDRDSGLVVGARANGLYGFPNAVVGELRFLDYAKTDNRNYGIDVLGSEGQLTVRCSGD
ncbi:MAG: Gfo/Idh/MocA family oxidoreductase, partial [Candidatus Poribacteria bacterium]|nr:Gfo/Idh/MocA family oxidoreductase [Candidatus Poribacteria bacterium]